MPGRRKFDRIEAQKLVDSGLSYAEASRRLGVSKWAVRNALKPMPLNRRIQYYRKCRYGVVPGEFDQMLEEQKGLCAICRKSSDKVLRIDHCHKTERVRGLLCHGCNTGIGHLKEDENTMIRAIQYIKKGGFCGED